MKNPRNKLNVAVSNAVSSTTNEVNLPSTEKSKPGRPTLEGQDKLFATSFSDFKELEKFSIKLKDTINISSFSSLEDQNFIRENIKKRRKIGTSVARLLKRIKLCKNPKFKIQLTESKNNLLKELDEIPAEGQLELEEKTLNSVGKPPLPLIVYYARAEIAFEDSKLILNEYETNNGLTITSISDFRKQFNEDKNKPKVGRKPNSQIYKYDIELKKIKNRIYQIEGNISENIKHGVNTVGRRRHAEKQLAKQNRAYQYLYKKVLKLESQMSEHELSQRYIKKLKHDRQGLRQKIYNASKTEINFLNRQIFELNIKIKEEECRYKQLCNTKAQNKIPEKQKEALVNSDLNLISIDELLLDFNLEKTKINERNKYLSELIEKITAKKKAA